MRGWAVAAEPLAQLCTLVVVVGRVPGDIGGFFAEEARHEDEVAVVFVGVGEDVGALQDLVAEAEDVVEDKDGFFGVGGAGDVWRTRLVGWWSLRQPGWASDDLQVFMPLRSSYLPFVS